MKHIYIAIALFCISCQSLSRFAPVKDGETLKLSVDSLYFRSSGFRYVMVDGEEWWVNRLTVQNTSVDVSGEERDMQQCKRGWTKSCAWLTVERSGDSLTVSVDAEKKMKSDDEHFWVEIQNRETSVKLRGTLGGILAGVGEDISPSMCGVVLGREGGRVRIGLNGGSVDALVVNGKNPPGWPRVRPDLNEYTLDWLTVHCVPGKVLELEATENLTKEPRTFSLRLTQFDSATFISGIQHAAVDIPPTDTIGFVPRKVHFPLEGASVKVLARTDGWVLDEQSYGLEWLTIEQDSNRLILKATPNFNYDVRHFTLRFKKGCYYEYVEGDQRATIYQ